MSGRSAEAGRWRGTPFVHPKGCPGVMEQAALAHARVLAEIDRNPPTGAAKVIHDALAGEIG